MTQEPQRQPAQQQQPPAAAIKPLQLLVRCPDMPQMHLNVQAPWTGTVGQLKQALHVNGHMWGT